jgi:histidyl-tRNA synthetase
MASSKVERVRGTSDILPNDYAVNKHLESEFTRCFEAFGYRPIDVPILEHTDLYLKKSGPDIVSRLYDFTHYNRRLCLRPEMTASVVRSYVEHLQEVPLPLRLYYAGPVFRYEKPQRGRYRQFTQVGVELFGAAGAMADAEIIAIACKGLDVVGLSSYRIALGHIGILAEYLRSLSLDRRLRSFLLTKMEVLKKEGAAYVWDRIHEVYSLLQSHEPEAQSTESLPDSGEEADRLLHPPDAKTLTDLLHDTDDATTQTAIMDLFEAMNIQLEASRRPGKEDRSSAEIIDRLLAKTQRRDQTAQIQQALEFMQELGTLVGEPSDVIPAAERLLERHHLGSGSLDQVRAIIRTLPVYGIDPHCIGLDFGMSRGLHYYTGMIFEIYHSSGDEKQVCGGGRYDDLVATLGGRKDTHATGFAYGIERLRLALEREGRLSARDALPAEVLIIPVGSDDSDDAIGAAVQLRAHGVRVELGIRSRSMSSQLQYADKRHIPFVVVIGPEERAASELFLKDLRSREERRVPLPDIFQIVQQIQQMRNDHA